MKQYDYIIVGSGLFGSIFAQQAKEAGRSALVLEKRPHIGGNCFSYDYEGTNITVHKYGTHIFHTNSEAVWKYINRFTGFNRYQHRVLTTARGRVFAMPINLGTINAFYGVNLRPGEVDAFLESRKKAIKNPRNLEEMAISRIGEDLYEAFIKGYTSKHWGRDPRELPASVVARLPVRSSYFDSYFDDRYQGIPLEGYTPIFERLLDGVPVELGVDFLEDPEHWRRRGKTLVYSGPLDAWFGHAEGRLNWRSVRLEFEKLPIDDFQGTSVMNYADAHIPYTRIHEPKHLHREKAHTPDTTVIMREYALDDPAAPFYPVAAAEDRALLEKYQAMARAERNVIFGGRLAEYKYYDMHQVIAQALQRSREALSGKAV